MVGRGCQDAESQTDTALLTRATHSKNPSEPIWIFNAEGVIKRVVARFLGLGYERSDIAAFQQRLIDEIGAIPGVAAVGFAADPRLGGNNMSARLLLPGEDSAAGRAAGRNNSHAGYFRAAGIPIVHTSAVVIVTESTARNLLPDRDPIGQTLVRRVGVDQQAR